ncbi:oligosaccharide flippase family protein [Acidisphaera sp. S103]|uniref:oligosaccharide flippase family protein n=1 Tax=Acidisphaera sp. S103 TaxID=1747223 RepID=UPI00131DDC77|nr:oligosaccharide flippase family protein [Acidisphaera sp. S103]
MTLNVRLGSSPAAQAQILVSDRRLALGAAVMAVANIAKIGIQFAMLPIMARLLGPHSYGLYALALPTVTFMLMVADGGLGNSLARENLETHAVWASAFWAVHGLALLLAAGVIGWSFLLAYITSQPELPALMATLSLALLFLASSVLPMARLLRKGRLHVGALADLVATGLGAGLGIVLAYRGAGTWALVGQYVVTFAIRACIMNLIAFQMPAFVFDLSQLRPHLLLGGSIIGGKLADYAGRITENALISTILGANILGVYGFANQIPRFLCESASNPLWAVLYVQAVQKPEEAVIRAYYRFSRLLGIVLFPVTLLSAVASSQIIGLFLGVAWHAAALPLSILLATSTFPTIGGLSSALVYARGRGGLQLCIGGSLIAARVLVVLAAGSLGLDGIAAVIGAVNVAYGIVAIMVPARVVGTSPRVLLHEMLAPFGCAMAAGAACEILLHIFGSQTHTLILAEFVSLLVYLGLLVMLEHRRLIEDIAMLRALLKK